MSVTVPVLVPLMRTEAPTIGRLSSSEMTTPVTVDTCAIAMLIQAKRQVQIKNNFFFHKSLVFNYYEYKYLELYMGHLLSL